MKLIIDIPEDLYHDIQNKQEFVQNFPNRYNLMILNGTPFDSVINDIKAEIVEEYKRYLDMNDIDWMKEIKCPHDLNQFLIGEPIFENPFPEEECKQRKFYGDCYHCFATAIASRDHQLLKKEQPLSIIENIKTEIEEYRNHILDKGVDDVAYGELNATYYALNVINKHIGKEN